MCGMVNIHGRPPPVVKAVKGDIIILNMDGTDRHYRVLNYNENDDIVEVVGLFKLNGTYFNSTASNKTYQSSALDTYLNTTWYNTLSATAKAAIIDKTFRQDTWYLNNSGNPDYNGTYYNGSATTNYTISLGSSSYGNSITRHVYALSVQDVVDYLEVTPQMTSENSTLNKANLEEMFGRFEGRPWFRSVYPTGNYGLLFQGVYSNIVGGSINSNGINYYGEYTPAFQIDLSLIDWSFYTDLTNTTWYFKEEPNSFSAAHNFNINFTSNNTNYTSLSLSEWWDESMIWINYNNGPSSVIPIVYNGGWYAWEDQAYRTITITGGDDVDNHMLYDWLNQNATQVL